VIPGVRFCSLDWKDYDQDGDLDLLLAGDSAVYQPISRVFRNDGNSLVATDVDLPGVWDCAARWVDVDLDEDLDILLSGCRENRTPTNVTKLFINQGDDRFLEHSDFMAPVRWCSIAAGDLDADKDHDLVVVGRANGACVATLYRNDDAVASADGDVTADLRPSLDEQAPMAGSESSRPRVVEIAKLMGPDCAPGDKFGIGGVFLRGDLAVVGAPRHDALGVDTGAVYLFERALGGAGTWERRKKLLADDASPGDMFGRSMAVSGDTLFIGSPGDDASGHDSGSVYVLERNKGGIGNWGEVKKLTASDGSPSDWFGFRLDAHGDTLIVGTWRAGANYGAVYVYSRDHSGANNWGEVKKLVALDPQPNDQFSRAAAVEGDVIVVGAYQYGHAGPGKAYLFERNKGGSNNWGLVKKFTVNDGAADDSFGGRIAISGDTLAIGCGKHDWAGENAGAVYIFERNRGGAENWGLVKKLVASDAVALDKLGFGIALEGDRLVVTAPAHARSESGNAYLFERNRGGLENWGEVTSFRGQWSHDAGKQIRVAMEGNTVIISAPHDDGDKVNDSGAAYVFKIE
jgi:hypothetical protein